MRIARSLRWTKTTSASWNAQPLILTGERVFELLFDWTSAMGFRALRALTFLLVVKLVVKSVPFVQWVSIPDLWN